MPGFAVWQDSDVRVRLLLGPAGSGKTFRCLAEIRELLCAAPEGPPLLLIAPKQATYQLERQLLADQALPGYTRLHILSFDRLADFVFDRLQKSRPELLSEEGRLMVLRGLLAKKRDQLKLFRASSRLTGFAQQLSLVLRELQRNEMTPESLNRLAGQVQNVEGLAYKLQDLATLLRDYLDWLKAHKLQDAERLLAVATETLDSLKSQVLSLKPGHSPESFRASSQEVAVHSPQSTVHSPHSAVQNPQSRHKGRESGGQLELSFGEGLLTTDHGLLAADASRITDHASRITPHPSPLSLDSLWVDGLAEWSAQELEFLAALLPHCEAATLTFCLDHVPMEKVSWLSTWSVTRNAFEQCKARLAKLPAAEVTVELLERNPDKTRFESNPVLQHLEQFWAEPKEFAASEEFGRDAFHRVPEFAPPDEWDAVERVPTGTLVRPELDQALRVVVCANPEAEVTLAAREILRHLRAGGRYREAAVLVRKLEGYHEALQRIFARYEIPFFLDRRESVSHHPLAELTRSALRTVASDWLRDDWFAALKTGLVPAEDHEIDRLENEALARGWKGATWQRPITVANEPELTQLLADLHHRILPPFQRLALALAAVQQRPTGPQLAIALREFWQTLNVEQRLQEWAEAEIASSEFRAPNSVHATVWEQMNGWLENVELAFPDVALRLRDWLPILDAGLANLTVGVIPPALDQVLMGAVDRSRTPDVKLALVLGLNETVFPALPERTELLTDLDRAELEKQNIVLSANARQQLGRERYYAYIACTRARQRLVLTSAVQDADGSPLNPSPFLSQVKKLFPSLKFETVQKALDWRESEHASELIGPLLTVQSPQSTVHSPRAGLSLAKAADCGLWTADCGLLKLPALASVIESLGHFRNPDLEECLSPELAARLYGEKLRTSVSRIEQFAACPFRFFVHSGLRAEERQLFELDVKEQGSFQHDVLAYFHQDLRREGKKWRDLTPPEARERVAKIARGLMASYREGLLQASDESRFTARVLTGALQDFVETLVGWMRGQYRFDPVEVELPFGEDEKFPAWEVDLGNGHRLALQGRIDRVDVCRSVHSPQSTVHSPQSDQGLCVVVDYKSSQKKLDPVLMAHGLQLQLLGYLNVLRHWPNPRELFGADRLVPAGVFYVNLRGKFDADPNRTRALADLEQARKRAYPHSGRFDACALRQLDARADARKGDQFNYKINDDGTVGRSSREAMSTADFRALLDSVETNLKQMGRAIFSGVAKVAPYRKGTTTACDQCGYRAICRIDPWTHGFRVLKKPEEATQ